MTPLGKHCAIVAAGPSCWWQDKAQRCWHPRKPVPYRIIIDDYLRARKPGDVFTADEIWREGLTKKTIRTMLGTLANMGTLVRIGDGKYRRA